MDVDFQGGQTQEQKNRILQDYFADQFQEPTKPVDPRALRLRKAKGPGFLTLLTNIVLVIFFGALYSLIVYNFVIHTIDQFKAKDQN